MAVFRLTIAFLALRLVAAAPPPSCPTTDAGGSAQGRRALLQKGQTSVKRRALDEQADGAESRSLEVDARALANRSGAGACPWSGTTTVGNQMQCVDGSVCDMTVGYKWKCCRNHGGRGKCPPHRPLMCERKSCSSGTEHCCKTSCQNYDGLRSCPPSGVCPYRGTTDVDDQMQCADGHMCEEDNCCDARGGIALCPRNMALLCDNNKCQSDCSSGSAGGLRVCKKDVTMIGNSFTHYNDGVDSVLRYLFSATGTPRVVEPLTKGGANWTYHLSEANTAGTDHHEALDPSRAGQVGYVIVQEQSYIPGTCCSGAPDDATFQASLTNLLALDDKIAAQGAQTVLYQTWGWRDGHGSRSYLSTFEDFNERVMEGYYKYMLELVARGRTPLLAPVGEAFQILKEDLDDSGEGSGPGSLFYRLFDDDAVHPSPLGTYLAGLVIFKTITGQSVTGQPAFGIDAEDAEVLQDIATQATS